VSAVAVPRGAPLASILAPAGGTAALPPLVVNKVKFLAGDACPKRLYYVEEAAAMRHRAFFLRRNGESPQVLEGAPAATFDEDDEVVTTLRPGLYDDKGRLMPRNRASSEESIFVPDDYAAMLVEPPPSVLIRFVEANRLRQWAQIQHVDYCRRALRSGEAEPIAVKAAEEEAEAKSMDRIKTFLAARERKDPSATFFAMTGAVVGYTLPDGTRVRARMDLLHFVPAGCAFLAVDALGRRRVAVADTWEAIDVKACLDLKKEHLRDASRAGGFLEHVFMRALNIRLGSYGLAHINRKHHREPHQFTVRDTNRLKQLAAQFIVVESAAFNPDVDGDVLRVAQLLKEYRELGPPENWALHFASPALFPPTPKDERPANLDAVSQQQSLCRPECSDCRFATRCIPKRSLLINSVFTVPRLPNATRGAYWNSGIRQAVNTPPPLSGQQERYVASILDGPQVDGKLLTEFVRHLQYPIVILDFEATQFAVPPFANLTAYDHVPFQFSAHVYYTDICTETPQHHEYLHMGEGFDVRDDPRVSVAVALSKVFNDVEAEAARRGLHPPVGVGAENQKPLDRPLRIGAVLAHHASFEKTSVRKLELACEAKQRGDVLLCSRYTAKNLPWADSMMLGKAVTVAEAGGSTSLKCLLPAFAPNSTAGSYAGLHIANGGDASAVYALLATAWNNPDDAQYIAQVAADLKAYCKLDTLAVAELVRGALSAAAQAGVQVTLPTPVTSPSPPPSAAGTKRGTPKTGGTKKVTAKRTTPGVTPAVSAVKPSKSQSAKVAPNAANKSGRKPSAAVHKTSS
jgi:hypothetical protein